MSKTSATQTKTIFTLNIGPYYITCGKVIKTYTSVAEVIADLKRKAAKK